MKSFGIIALALGLLVPLTQVHAQSGMTDLIPRGAAVAVAIRNLDDLKKKGNTFLKESDLNIGLRPSDIFDHVYKFLGLQGGIDETGPAVLILMPPEKEGDAIGLNNLEELLLGAIPVADPDKLAANFDLQPGDLKPNQILKAKGANFVNHVLLRDKHLYVANSRRTLERVAEQKSVSKELGQDQVKAWNQADILVHLGAREWKRERQEILREFTGSLKKVEDSDEKRILEELIDALKQVQFAVGAIRLDDGFGLEVTTLFDPDHPGTQKFLKSFEPGPGLANLSGLPAGRAVVAHAIQGDGARTSLLAKALFWQLLKEIPEAKRFLSPNDRANYLGVFTEVWAKLKGHRAALYLSSDESKFGLFNLVALLDTEDAPKFIADLRLLAKMAEGNLEPSAKTPEEKIDIAQLAADLGSPKYRLRESATNRLRLIGEPALPFIEKILENADLETSTRAKRLKMQIAAVAAERRKELLLKEPAKTFRPQFAFVAKAEMRGDHKVDMVQIKLTGAEQALAGQLKQVFGPEWDHLRLVVHGKQVAVLLGSEVKWLDDTLDNLKKGKKGLADSPALATFSKQAPPPRMVDVHASLDSLLALITPGVNPPGQGSPALSSASLGLGMNQLHLRVFIPFGEIKTLKSKNLFFF